MSFFYLFDGTVGVKKGKYYIVYNVILYLYYLHNTDGVGETRALLPASNNHDRISGLDEAILLAHLQTKLHTHIDILKPVRLSGLYKVR